MTGARPVVSDSPADSKHLGILKNSCGPPSPQDACSFVLGSCLDSEDFKSFPHDSNKQPRLKTTDSDPPQWIPLHTYNPIGTWVE